MQQTFQVQNVKCGGCANTLSSKLQEEFGEVSVNLEVFPREITLDLEDKDLLRLREILKSIGYPMSDEDLGFMEENTLKAKSFVSCAVGKFELSKEGKKS